MTKSIFKKEFEDEIIDVLLANNIDDKYVKQVRTEIFKCGFPYKGNYKKFLDELESKLLFKLSIKFKGEN